MAGKDLFKLLTSPDKGVSRTFGSKSLLSRLFRQLMKDLNVGPERFGALMRDYINDPRNHIPRNRKDMTSARGNLGAALSKPQMTWKVFCKGLAFLKIWKIDIAIRVYHSNGKKTDHYTSMTLTEYRKPEEDTEAQDSDATNHADANEDERDDE